MKKVLLFFSIFLVGTTIALAQVPINLEQRIRSELRSKGLDETKVLRKMKEKGVDPKTVDRNNPAELERVERTLREVIAEMEKGSGSSGEAKKGVSEIIKDEPRKGGKIGQASEVVQGSSEEIQEAVEEGATVEEAVAEEISEALEDALPPPVTWGQQVFRDKSISIYRQSKDVKPPDSYILGPGDRVTVSIWGYSQENVVFELNEDGYIKPEAMPRIYLKGIAFGKAKKLIESRFSGYYRFRPEEFEVTLNFARTISINIVGEVFNFGSFTMPARNSVFNALVASGGPTNIGSVRKIRLIRVGEKDIIVDVYRFLLDPSAEESLFLQQNDYIHVPIADRLVKIAGAVNRPHQYELVEGENLLKLIEFSGGLTLSAFTKAIQIQRLIGSKQELIDVNLDELKAKGEDFELLNGDLITIKKTVTPYDNYVEISGAVEAPGKYALKPDMKITDLLELGELRKDAMKDFSFLQRANLDGTARYERINLNEIINNPNSAKNFVLEPRDKLITYILSRYVDGGATVSIDGAVRNGGKYAFDASRKMSVKDLVELSGGLKIDATEHAYVFKRDTINSKINDYIRINIWNAVADPSSGDNLILEPTDRVRVFSVTNFTDSRALKISGAVRKGADYPYYGGIRLSDLIYLSNGLMTQATDFGYLIRQDTLNRDNLMYLRLNVRNAVDNPGSSDDIELEPLDQIRIFSKESYTDQYKIKVTGEVRNSGEYVFGEGFTVQDALTLSGGLKIEAASSRIDVYRIIIEQNKPTKTVAARLKVDENLNIIEGGEDGFELQPFDDIIVRRLPNFKLQQYVSITGEVKYPGAYPLLHENERISDLLKRCEGLTIEAFPEGATLKRSRGEKGYVILRLDEVIKKSKSLYNYILKPGDVVNVPISKELVGINIGNTRAEELYLKNVVEASRINIAYQGKRAMYYVKKYAGGLQKEKGSKKKITVEYPNGEIKRTKNFGLFKITPKLKKGAIVSIGRKVPKSPKGKHQRERKPVDWGRVVTDAVAQATTVLTLILLVQSLD